MESRDLIAGAVIAVGLIGIVVPLLPGTLLVAGAILGWAAVVGETTGWLLAGVALLMLALGTVVKYAVPHRRLRASGVPNRTLAAGGLLGLVGFFVIPVVGLPLGFVAGIYVSELQRLGKEAAWPATVAALKAVGLSLLIELTAALMATALWAAGALST